MNITKVTVKKIEGQQTLRGVASVVLDDEIKIRDIKILAAFFVFLCRFGITRRKKHPHFILCGDNSDFY